jgi:hypothetical protein
LVIGHFPHIPHNPNGLPIFLAHPFIGPCDFAWGIRWGVGIPDSSNTRCGFGTGGIAGENAMNLKNLPSWSTSNRINRKFRGRRVARAAMDALEPRRYMHFDPDHPDHFDRVPMSPLAINAPLSPHVGPFLSATAAGSIPALNSNPDATAQLYLDFAGYGSISWGGKTTGVTPAYDTDGDAGTFTAGELSNIQEIWSRVSEIYSPFNINVTTVDPGNLTDGVTTEVVIGGTGSWYGSAGGVAYIGAFSNGASNIAWVFPKMLANGNTKYTAEAISHEAGHTFGLQHQSKYSGSTKTAEYNPGTAAKAPIMGNSYSATRALWWNGQSAVSASTIQDDVSVISSNTNGFGYRSDDHGGSIGAATALDLDGDAASGSGIIEKITDTDYFSFTTLAGDITLSVSPAQYAGMLDAKLTLLDSDGTTLATADTSSLGETISTSLSAGTYYLVVASEGNTGDLGQYTISGTIITSPDYVARPSGLSAAATGGQVVLSWTDHASNETGFVVQRSDDGGSTWDDVGTASANATGYTDSTVDVGTAYKYRVKATGSAQDSSFSTTVSVNVLPDTPTDLAAASVSASQIDLEWTDVDGETSYRIDRSLNGTTWSQLATPAANATSYSDTGLSANTKYYYRIVAVTSLGNSGASSSVNATTTPAQPTTLAGTVTTTSITLTWKDVAGETGYRIERSLNNSSWSQIATTGANVAKYVNSGLFSSTKYYYRVKAIGAGGDSVASDTLTKMTLATAPLDVYVYAPTATSLKVSWADQVGETGYRLEKLSGTTWSQVGDDLAANKVVTTVTGLSEGTAYTFRVTALNDSGASTASATAKGTTLSPAPATLTAAASTVGQVSLTWTNVATETGFRIERSLDGDTWKWIGTTAADVLTFTDTLLKTGTEYFYRVCAMSDGGKGAFSSAANVTTTASSQPVAATAFNTLSLQNGGSVVETVTAALKRPSTATLQWKRVSGSKAYRIERLASSGHWTAVSTVKKTVISYTDKLAKSGVYQYRIVAMN